MEGPKNAISLLSKSLTAFSNSFMFRAPDDLRDTEGMFKKLETRSETDYVNSQINMNDSVIHYIINI